MIESTKNMFEFNDTQIERYSRHIILPHVGGKGQKKLLQSKVLVIGTGGLGSPALFYLAAAGVGTLGIVDDDEISLSNLQRQILHTTPEIGTSKTDSAAKKLNAINPDVHVVQHQTRVDASNIMQILEAYDLVVDATDNFPARFLINDACVMSKKPLIHAGIFRFEGQILTIIPGKGPCYRCLFPEPPPPGLVPGCHEAGILGCVAGVMGTIQATEAIKVLLDLGEPLIGRMLTFDALEMNFRRITVPRDNDCAVCSGHPTITELIDYEQTCNVT